VVFERRKRMTAPRRFIVEVRLIASMRRSSVAH
jgi:hypothetical protein